MSLVLLLLVASVVFLVGPKVEIDTSITPLELPQDLDVYLDNSESEFKDIKPNTEKKIIWTGNTGEKTPLSVVYLHGFTATRQESAPLSDIVAKQLGANLFYTRLTGHGRTTEAMLEGNVNKWVNDAHEALEIGRRIGDKVIVIGMSAGGALAFWLSSQATSKDVEAYVLISPSFRLADRDSRFLMWPWGAQIAELAVGKEICRKSQNPQHEKYWTHCYPTRALLPLKGLIGYVRSLDFKLIKTPMLMIISPEDTVVDVKETMSIFEKIGSDKKELAEFEDTEDPHHHNLAGDILSPKSTKQVAKIIINFIQ
ncbi:MAG: alpha/beta fold hydrolase [Pseudomonadota bacterium]